MWARGIAGLVLCVLGGVWILQGAGVIHGSSMSGHGQCAVLGVVALVLGLALLGWAARVKRRPAKTAG
jgi:hypothetical protein